MPIDQGARKLAERELIRLGLPPHVVETLLDLQSEAISRAVTDTTDDVLGIVIEQLAREPYANMTGTQISADLAAARERQGSVAEALRRSSS